MTKTIGENIKKYRKSKGLTQIQLAQKVNVGVNSIRRYEAGERQPNFDKLDAIANALEININDLISVQPMPMILPESDDGFVATNGVLNPYEKKEKVDMIMKYNKLNTLGQHKANEYITDLSEQEKYTKPDNED
ncbi:MAG: helix-turn-helix domain-containing protein [Oscillospiraceae bacterium]|nr:helix-turn-helix domain-containing protein [Oscillospiraceae bacterium]